MCAVSLAACSGSDEMPQDTNVANGIKQVGENEYVVTMEADAVGASDSRGISGNMFDNIYEPTVLYVHSNKENSGRKVLTFQLADDKSFTFRIRRNDDGSFALSSDVNNVIDTSKENAESYDSDEKVYFSSWPEEEWTNEVQPGVQVGVNESIPVMYLQKRDQNSDWKNWREIYRSALNKNGGNADYNAKNLLAWQGDIAPSLGMMRIVSGYMNAVIFTDLTVEGKESVETAEEWGNIITDENGNDPSEWTIRLYLGEFPTSYNLRTSTNGKTMAYYASNQGVGVPFAEVGYSPVGGIVGTATSYHGFGLKTAEDYLLTPVAENTETPLEAYILVNNSSSKTTIVSKIEEFGTDDLGGSTTSGACYPIPNQIEQLVVIYDLRDLAQKFGLKYKNAAGQEVVWQNGKEVEASKVSVQSLKSRASGSETEFVELQPRKVIRKTIY